MSNQEDLLALVEAVLEGKESGYSEVVKQIRIETEWDLRSSAYAAKIYLSVLRSKGNKKADEILKRIG